KMVETVMHHGIDGMIIANTTLDRGGLSDPLAREQGGLSGRPLFQRSTALLAEVRAITAGEMVLIGVGGIDSAATAWDKMAAGADLVQLYSGMIYEGPGLAARITTGLTARLEREGVACVHDIVGTGAQAWLRAS
ncbi:MAG: quinone-dependent dihydroorotate dehydrogenase, partial [Alphaproteobacteria bacterium]